MNYRLSTILPREEHLANTTKLIDIDVVDPISRITIVYEPVNGAEAQATDHPAKCISKIELVDGSDVLFSLSGVEAQAADWYNNKQETSGLIYYLTGSECKQVFNINFGRDLWDPLHAFNPKKHTNPQLKVTIDIDGGGMSVASGYLTVLAYLFDQKVVEPAGFFMYKEIKDYAMGAGTHEYTDLPTDYPYRKLFVRALKAGVGPDYCLGNIKLTEDFDKKIPLDATIRDILSSLVGQTRPMFERIITHGHVAFRYYWCTPGYWPVFAFAGWTSSTTVNAGNVYEGDGGRFKLVSTTAGLNSAVLCHGFCPHNVIEIPFGRQEDPADWFDASKLGNLKLDVTSGSTMSSSESAQIFLQQLRKY